MQAGASKGIIDTIQLARALDWGEILWGGEEWTFILQVLLRSLLVFLFAIVALQGSADLPLVPPLELRTAAAWKQGTAVSADHYSCLHCGKTLQLNDGQLPKCPNCSRDDWVESTVPR